LVPAADGRLGGRIRNGTAKRTHTLAEDVDVAHCQSCQAYETAVMGRQSGESLPETVVPCDAYVMSIPMREWTVRQMQGEVMRQLNGAGLDRMAILKRPATTSSPE
jgi:hypothetical protein